jgi:hypothetical protein
MGEGDQGREHQDELSGSKHSALERCVVHYSKFRRSMSALGQKQTLHRSNAMSALPPKADITESDRHVRFVPKADVHSKTSLDHLPGAQRDRRHLI